MPHTALKPAPCRRPLPPLPLPPGAPLWMSRDVSDLVAEAKGSMPASQSAGVQRYQQPGGSPLMPGGSSSRFAASGSQGSLAESPGKSLPHPKSGLGLASSSSHHSRGAAAAGDEESDAGASDSTADSEEDGREGEEGEEEDSDVDIDVLLARAAAQVCCASVVWRRVSIGGGAEDVRRFSCMCGMWCLACGWRALQLQQCHGRARTLPVALVGGGRGQAEQQAQAQPRPAA